MNRCTCQAPTASQQRQLVSVGQQLGLYGLRVSRGLSGVSSSYPAAGATGTYDDGTYVVTGDGASGSAEGDVLQKTPGGTPGAVWVSSAAWNFEATPYARYTLQSGDTLAGLAITYLGSGTRWKEIWDVQDGSYKASRSPDKIYVGDVINMPAEAATRAKQLVHGQGGGGAAKSGGGLLAAILVGGTVAAATAGVVYLASRSHRRRRALAAA